MSEVHTTLVKAKAYLLTHGWVQGSFGANLYRGDDGPVCAVGALIASRSGAVTEAQETLVCVLGGPAMAWNDTPGRTLDEVIDLFDRAIIQTAPKDTPASQPETPSPSVAHVFA